MADRKVRYVLEVDYEGESVTARAADDLREVDDAAKQASDGLEQASGGFSRVQASIVTMQSALGIAEQGFAAIQQAAQFAYETLSEGAALADARGDFEDLAASVGTTADALENELGAAAAGLITDAELIGQAGELMAMGLGLSKDEIVTLTGLAAELDWNFKTLTDTLNTGSTRGLKELGLSIDVVKEKMATLEEQGMSTDEAFRWAIIDAAEEKVDRVGKKSEEASGQLQQLETIVANVQDEFARGAAEGFADALGVIAGSAPAVGAALESASRGASDFLGEMAGYILLSNFSGDLAYLIERGQQLEAEERRQADAVAVVTQGRADLAEMTAIYGDVLGDLLGKVELSADAADYGLGAWNGLIEAYKISAASAAMAAENGFYLYDSMMAQAEAAANEAAMMDLLAAAQAEWSKYVGEMTAAGGDAFTGFMQADKAWEFADGIYAAADAAGAGAGPLAELAESLGLIEDASGALDSVANQAIADSLAQAAVDGRIAWDDYADAVQRAIDVYNGAPLVDLGPREMPEMDMRGYRANFQEALEMMPNEMDPIPLEVQLEQESIAAAVAEARGVVEGFTETPWETAVKMDITEVIEKGGEVQSIIESLPDYKSITVDFTATGLEFLEELRAAGVIP